MKAEDVLKITNYLDRARIAGNPDTPKDILTILSKDDKLSVRKMVAINPNTPCDVLLDLAKTQPRALKEEMVNKRDDLDERVLMYLATEHDVLRDEDKDYSQNQQKTVINALCQKRGLPENIYRALAKRKMLSNVVELYSNPDIPADLIEEMAKVCIDMDKDDEPQDKAHIRNYTRILHNIAANPKTSKDILMSLMRHSSKVVRFAAVQNANLDETFLDNLIENPFIGEELIRGIARNPNVSDITLHKIIYKYGHLNNGYDNPVSVAEHELSLRNLENAKAPASMTIEDLPKEYVDMMVLIYQKTYEEVLNYYRDCCRKKERYIAFKAEDVISIQIKKICQHIIDMK